MDPLCILELCQLPSHPIPISPAEEIINSARLHHHFFFISCQRGWMSHPVPLRIRNIHTHSYAHIHYISCTCSKHTGIHIQTDTHTRTIYHNPATTLPRSTRFTNWLFVFITGEGGWWIVVWNSLSFHCFSSQNNLEKGAGVNQKALSCLCACVCYQCWRWSNVTSLIRW